jgi:hypothetical protein
MFVVMPLEIFLGDVVRLRKPHPCGGYEWQVVRLGADIGIACQTCQHRVLLPRREFEKRVKTFVRRGENTGASSAARNDTPMTND